MLLNIILKEPSNVMTIKITTDKKALLTSKHFTDEIKEIYAEQ